MAHTPAPAAASPRHVVVIGGGISGLAAAERLTGDASTRVTIVEASERLGGMVGTDRVDGFVIERGADVMLATKPAARRLCERLGIDGSLQGTAARGGWVARAGRLRRLPDGLSGLMPTRLAPIATSGLLSPLGLARLATEPVRRAAVDLDDESVASFMTRRLGREMYERVCEPLLAGIYSGNGTKLSMEATFPQLRAMEREHGSLLRGLRARARTATPNASANASPFLSFPGGLQTLIDALAARLDAAPNVQVRLRTRAAAMRRADGESIVELANGEAIACDAVIVATPAPVAAALLGGVCEPLGREIASIELGSVGTISLAFDASDVAHPLDGTGYVVPRPEGRPVLACTWVSSKHRGRAPEGSVLLRLFFGGAHRPDVVSWPASALVALARAEVQQMLGIAAAPKLVRITRWTDAMPQYHLGHPARVARIEAHEASLPWLAIAGNAYRGVGVPDCIASGERAAARVLAGLTMPAALAVAP